MGNEKSLQEEFEESIEQMDAEGSFDSVFKINDAWTQDYTGTGQYISTYDTSNITINGVTIGTDTTLDKLVYPTEESRGGNLMAINERLDTIERHLGVLTNKPSQELLDKYGALKNAYNEYKLIEKIVLSGKDADEQG